MKTFEIKGSLRENVGKKPTKATRKEGNIPCVMYGGEQNVHFKLEAKLFDKLILTPNVYLVKLDLEGKVYDAILKEVQYHPVSDAPLHVDFLQIEIDKKIQIDIPVILTGLAPGVKAGGKLHLMNRRLTVKAFPADLPDNLEISVDELVLGKTIKVGELAFDNLELLTAKNSVVASVKLTRIAKGADTDEDEAEGEEATEEEATEEKSE